MAAKTPEERLKRKRDPAASQPKKRQRPSDEAEDEDVGARILFMEKGILESRKHYNDISVLLQLTADIEDNTEDALLATVALCRVFVRLLAQGSLTNKKGSSERDKVVVGWLKDQFSQYKMALVPLLRTEEYGTTILTLGMRVLKAEGEYLSSREDYSFPQAFLESIVSALIASESDELRTSFIEQYVEEFDDIRFYTFKALRAILETFGESIASETFDRVLALLSALDGVPESAEELEDFFIPQPRKKSHPLRSVAQHKKQGQEAWVALLRRVESRDQRKRVLDVLSTIIAPWFAKPELLADFLTSSYDAGGSMALLALSGVFYLIQERNLDYPSFYPKLYSLLDRDILHSKHRSRFFRLLDTFLASTHLPAALVASFIKRLSRLALNAPPGSIVFVVPWIYNLLRRHPLCTFMLHREIRSPEAKENIQDSGFADPFLPDESDPMRTRAIESCLWELVQLQSHYHPNVATIAKIISEQFTKQGYNMEDFLDHSYASLLDAELGKDVKKAPVIEFHIPKKVFLPLGEEPAESDSLIARLWNFGPVAAL